MNMGWECPKCGRCYSPFTAQCVVCPNNLTLGGCSLTTSVVQCTCALSGTLACPVHFPLRSQTTIGQGGQ